MLLRLLLLACVLGAAPAVRAQGTVPSAAPEMLHEGDMLRVTIYGEREMSGEFLVNEMGVATVPLLGDRVVTGIPLTVLRDSLRAELRRQLRAPAIEITPLRRVFVLGEVLKPGPYLIDPTINLSGAVAMAGGPAGSADPRKVRIVRRDGSSLERVDVTQPVSALGPLRSGDQVYVGKRSWLSRNSAFVVSSAISLSGIIATVIITANR